MPAITIVAPSHPLVAKVAPPGSKSSTNRALPLAAMVRGTNLLVGALEETGSGKRGQAS